MRYLNRLPRCMKIKTLITTMLMFLAMIFLSELIKHRKSILGTTFRLIDESENAYLTNNYIPGSYFRNNIVSNDSYCNYKYGLPERFVWDIEDVQYPPEMGENSSYRVIYNVINATYVDYIPQLTYCTHITAEFVFHLSEIVRFWEGPISVSAFVPEIDADIAIRHLNQLCHCVPEMNKVSVHFIFPALNPPAIIGRNTSVANCTVPDLNDIDTYRTDNELTYPVNVARNIARVAAQTKYVLVSDVELIPSDLLASKFMRMLKRIQLKKETVHIKNGNFVFVVPVFEVEGSEEIPHRKSELLEMYADGKAVYFHRWICLHCQRFPGLHRWLYGTTDFIIKPLLVIKREYPYHRWEPIYIGTNKEPFYSELLSWEGQQDKMTQMVEMCLKEYRFMILDGAFLVHRPGMKRRHDDGMATAIDRGPGWRRRQTHVRANARVYAQIVRNLTRRYAVNHRCRAVAV